jgi:cell division protease FtsH
VKNLLLGAVLGFGLAVVLAAVLLSDPSIHLAPYETPYSRFITDLDDGKIEEVTFQGSKVFGRLKDHRVFQTVAPPSHVSPALMDRLLSKSVTVTVRADDASAASIVANWAPYLISLALFFGGIWFSMGRPVLALARQLDAYVKAMHQAPSVPPAQE